MLDEVNPDILLPRTTRQTYHADQIVAAVEAGVKGIVCDKPLVTTLEEGDRNLQSLYGREGSPSPTVRNFVGTRTYIRISDVVRDGA